MRLFNRENISNQEEPLTFESALLYVTGLSEEDWSKFNTVAIIRRHAAASEAEELGVQHLPKTFIRKPEQEIWNLRDDDPDADIHQIMADQEPEYIETQTDEEIRKAKAEEVAAVKARRDSLQTLPPRILMHDDQESDQIESPLGKGAKVNHAEIKNVVIPAYPTGKKPLGNNPKNKKGASK